MQSVNVKSGEYVTNVGFSALISFLSGLMAQCAFGRKLDLAVMRWDPDELTTRS